MFIGSFPLGVGGRFVYFLGDDSSLLNSKMEKMGVFFCYLTLYETARGCFLHESAQSSSLEDIFITYPPPRNAYDPIYGKHHAQLRTRLKSQLDVIETRLRNRNAWHLLNRIGVTPAIFPTQQELLDHIYKAWTKRDDRKSSPNEVIVDCGLDAVIGGKRAIISTSRYGGKKLEGFEDLQLEGGKWIVKKE